MRKPKMGDRVRILPGSADMVGTVAKNQRHLPSPYYVDVDLVASTFPAGEKEDAVAFFTDRYAGPYRASDLLVIE